MNELSAGSVLLRHDGEWALWRRLGTAQVPPSLVLAPTSRHVSAERLLHEHGLRDQLDPIWAVRPRELVQEAGKPVLLLDDPGGELLSTRKHNDDVGSLLRIATELASALAKTHAHGLIHQDIRPANILVDAGGRVRLTGFGLAMRADREHRIFDSGRHGAGSLPYIAPEQTGRMNRSVDMRSDLYSLGVTLYQLLAGDLPFSASLPIEWVHCHIARPPVPLEERAPALPATIAAIVMKLLAKAPEDRYQTAAGVEADLRRGLEQWEAGIVSAFPLGEADIPDRLVLPERLYGRAREIGDVLRAFERVATEGTAGLLLISGPSGIGKSVVARELDRALLARPGWFASGKFDPYKGNIPYAPLAQAFGALVRQLLTRSEEELAWWREALVRTLGPNARLMCELVAELSLVLGPQPPAPAVPLENARDRHLLAFRQFLSAFAQNDRPLALFLDDLQWLDRGTLDFIDHVVAHPDVKHVLVVGAYRSNEVSEAHPLTATLRRFRSVSAPLVEVELAGLSSSHVSELMTDALRAPHADVDDLSRLIVEKTEGNPFFALQFLRELWDARLISFDRERRLWTWDLDVIRGRPSTENIVELVLRRIERLPRTTGDALAALACFGNAASAAELASHCERELQEIDDGLTDAASVGLLHRGASGFSFVHDRVREAVYSLLSEEQRAALHARIGRKLRGAAPADMVESVFDVVGHLTRGLPLLSASERVELVTFSLSASKRAKSTGAHATARTYVSEATRILESLESDPWSRHPELMFELAYGHAECDSLCGELASAELRLVDLAARATRLTDAGRVVALRAAVSYYSGDFDRGLEVGLEYLNGAGSPLPSAPTDEDLAREYGRLREQIGTRSIADLADVPVCADELHARTLELAFQLTQPARWGNHDRLHDLLVCRMVNLSLERGHAEASAIGYLLLGMVVGPRFGDYAIARPLGELAIELVERHRLDQYRALVRHGMGAMIGPWSQPFDVCVRYERHALAEAQRIGEPIVGSGWFQIVSNYLASGRPLADAEAEAEVAIQTAAKLNVLPCVALATDQLRLIRTLRRAGSAFPDMSDASRDEAAFERDLETNPGMPLVTCWYWIRKLTVRFFARDLRTALHAANAARALIWSSASNVDVEEHHFYAALVHAGLCDGALPEATHAHRESLAEYKRQFDIWATHCPENFGAKAILLAAETARIEGRGFDAESLYEKAVRMAQEQGLIHVEAIASEHAARFYERRGQAIVTEAYLRHAHAAYRAWGAEAKVRALEHAHPSLLEGQRGGGPAALARGLHELDLTTVVRLSQAISQEIVLERLIETLLKAALEHAGAQRGVLVLPRGEALEVVAEARAQPDGVSLDLRRAPVSERELPLALLHYVRRTQESVLLGDAAEANQFSEEAYFRRRGSRSVLCLPLVKQARLVGVLHLENDLAPGIFTPGRFAILELLASQSAMSLENAQLYADLRQAKVYMSKAESIGQTGTFSWKPRTEEIFWSDEVFRIFGTASSPSVESMRARIHPHDVSIFDAIVADPSRLVEGPQVEYRLMMPDGFVKHVSISAHRVSDDATEQEQYVGAIRDVTEVRRSEEALQRTQAALADLTRVSSLGEMAAAIAHEISQPLAAIGANASACVNWLQRDPANPEEAREAASCIARDVTRAENVIRRLRALFGRSGEAHMPLDLNEAIREVVLLTRARVQRNGAAIRLDLADQLPPVLGDRVQLQQVIVNLVVNASEAACGVAPGPHEILVRTRLTEPDVLVLEVKDSGPGVSPEEAARLFSPFYTTKQGGMGMGLSICKTIVEKHGGRIGVRPNEDRGANFHVSLSVGR
ncbi:trifunctional serine/threonine-protein kinase/ATP-binding protein/sensor histidine kinase [Polyangium sorediatum]|uniref:histidine kinase n=1 Tax=Polyangium sorediatum TaxID=889274 RepID=A0ABT6NVY6_9BACT|nr:AAA family ATPase [Polyangium sorediatum]MDI1432507.1 AAA family ATPase [Polyangium sorediatum]